MPYFVLAQEAATAEPSASFMSVLNNPASMMWIAIACICVFPGIATAYALTRRREAEMAAVRDMVAAGYSAEEIDRIIKGNSNSAS